MATLGQTLTRRLKPFYHQVQSHYDLCDDFFALFLDPSRTYSCAYFRGDEMSLEEAQLAKIDLALSKCDLRPGMRLLDIGCGWGSTVRRAAERYKVEVVGLTLSENQHQYAKEMLADLPDDAGATEIRLAGWEEFDEPVDRIVSIGAFEHFRQSRYAEFFERCRAVLPGDGRMLLHTIVWTGSECEPPEAKRKHLEFARFMRSRIFPGYQLVPPAVVARFAESAGFRITQTEALGPHYARTLDCWTANLRRAEGDAVAMASREVYNDFIRYLTGCAAYFKSGHLDVMQFTLCAPDTGS